MGKNPLKVLYRPMNFDITVYKKFIDISNSTLKLALKKLSPVEFD